MRGQGRRLTASALARLTGTTAARIRALVAAGVLRPDPDGRFRPGDVQRVQVAGAYERGGIELDLLARAIRDGYMSFEFTDRIYPEASPPSGRTVGDLMGELGPAGSLLPDALLAMGIAQPSPDRPLSEADVTAIRDFLTAWTSSPIEASAALRAARLAGDAARRIAEGWTALFMEAVELPAAESRALTLEELEPRLFAPATRVAAALEPTLLWLLRHHLVRVFNDVNVAAMEDALEVEGVRRRADREPPAIVFADMSGFTRLTEELGDQAAVRHAEALGAMAAGVATTWSGRLVKQLGDGVMLAFERTGDAVEASAELLDAAEAGELPPLHVGISTGPVIERDGDVYGRTVNLASRLSGVAGPGEIVINEVAAAGLPSERVVALPPARLKGLGAPIAVFRLQVG